MKILALTCYDSLGASSRIRTYQYVPYLKTYDMDVTVSPLLVSKYLQTLYFEKSRKLSDIASSYIRRLFALSKAKKYDLIWIEKEIFKFFPAIFERLLVYLEIPYVVTFDDAIFHNYDLNPNPIFRVLMGKKIDVVMRNAKCVIAGNDYLAERALAAGANSVEIIPSVVDLMKYPLLSPETKSSFTIGWIGSPSTTKYLLLIQEALAEVCNVDKGRLVAIGCENIQLIGVPFMSQAWREESEAADISQFNVGIMPLPDDPWERGKCGFKLIQYMACGKPVVASPVGVNTKIIKNGINGYLANTKEEWVSALKKIQENPALAKTMGAEGRACVEKEYTVQVTVRKLADILIRSARVR